MREILFRGKRIDNGEWVEGWYLPATTVTHYGCMPETIGVSITYMLEDGFFEDTVVFPDTVGQYTGLTDKNGRKIFERDIVQFRTRGGSLFKPLYVRWYEETASFIVTESNCVRSYPMDRTWEYEVLGNFYDNIDLLKGADNVS